jgi:phosphohistidine phosphatase
VRKLGFTFKSRDQMAITGARIELRTLTAVTVCRAASGPPKAMRTLYLLRHAKSSWSDPTLPDRERPLAPRGRRDAQRVGEYLVRLAIVPDLVLCSAARRAGETLELVQTALGPTTSVLLEPQLYAASADRLLDRLRVVPDGVASVLVIGHNPGLQNLALLLASAGADLERLEAKFPTAALATLALPKATWGQLSPADALLDAFVAPKQLRRA